MPSTDTIYVQWATDPPLDYEPIAALAWANTPSKAVPTGGEVLDSTKGWVEHVNCQGILFRGDHIFVEPIEGGIKIITIWDDIEDGWEGKFTASEWRLRPPALDVSGKINTRQHCTVYSQDRVFMDRKKRVVASDGPVVVKPWSEFVYPPSDKQRHYINMPDELYARHRDSRPVRGWREWIEE